MQEGKEEEVEVVVVVVEGWGGATDCTVMLSQWRVLAEARWEREDG